MEQSQKLLKVKEKTTDRNFIVEGGWDQMGSIKKSRSISGSLRKETETKFRDEVMIKTEVKENVEDMSFK